MLGTDSVYYSLGTTNTFKYILDKYLSTRGFVQVDNPSSPAAIIYLLYI